MIGANGTLSIYWTLLDKCITRDTATWRNTFISKPRIFFFVVIVTLTLFR